MSGWPSGLRRQTQGIHPSHRSEISGPRMRAWVRIPLLTKTFFSSQQTLGRSLAGQLIGGQLIGGQLIEVQLIGVN